MAVGETPRLLTLHRSRLFVAAIAMAALLAGCGSGSRTAGTATEPTAGGAQQDALNFSRCMRAHGVSHFPDPSSSGSGVNFQDVPGIDPSSPAFNAAQTACKHLLPVKRPPSGPPSADARAQLIALARCMRTRGYSGLPDPKPNPPPSNASFGTAFGLGGYYIGIPNYMKPHSPSFVRALEACHQSP